MTGSVWLALLPGAAFFLGWLLTGMCRFLALKLGVLDFPGSRSAHSVPTPRGGGLAIVAVVLAASLAFCGLDFLDRRELQVLWLGGVPIAAVGLWDDLTSLPVRRRLLVQVLAVGAATLWCRGTLAGAWGWIGVLSWVWLVNLYNFMDGIDGLAAVEAVTVALGGAVIAGFGGDLHLAAWLLTLAAACGGFLIWNWPPARIFMGDVGSGFLGFVMGMLVLVGGHTGAVNRWSWLILLAVFVTDASVTLARRIFRGERWWRAHSSHAYQHLARRLGHKCVTMLVGLVNLVWLLPLAWLAARFPQWGWCITLAAYLPLGVLALRFRAGLPAGRVEGKRAMGDNS